MSGHLDAGSIPAGPTEVWLVVESFPYEGDSILGVYSTEALAEEASARLPHHYGCDVEVIQYGVDAE